MTDPYAFQNSSRWYGATLIFEAGWREKLAAAGISEDSWEAYSNGKLVSGSMAITSCRRIELAFGETIYFKRYSYRTHKRLRFWLRASKALREARTYRELAAIGIPAPMVIAVGEKRWLGFLRAAFIVTLAVRNSVDLVRFANDVWLKFPREQRKEVARDIAKKLAAQLWRAHDAGFFHHDLKWKNILIETNEAGLQPIWIDCPRAHQPLILRQRAVIRDLALLARDAMPYLSIREQLRFLHAYLGDKRDRSKIGSLVFAVQRRLARPYFSRAVPAPRRC